MPIVLPAIGRLSNDATTLGRIASVHYCTPQVLSNPHGLEIKGLTAVYRQLTQGGCTLPKKQLNSINFLIEKMWLMSRGFRFTSLNYDR
jgi:hypothetical protein